MATRKDATQPPRRRLGRGLTGLMSTPMPVDLGAPGEAATAAAGSAPATAEAQGSILMLDLDQVRPNPRQPRRRFDDATLDELAASIRTAGLMQPVVVRPIGTGEFELVVGERRWRAARKAGVGRIPAVVREIDDRTAAEWALIENIQREDLNPIDRADAFRRLTDDFGLTHQEVADRVGLNRSTVTNLLRLGELDDFSREAVRHGRLSQGHARVLLALTNIEARRHLAELAIRQGWSVRALERRASALAAPPRRRTGTAPPGALPAPHRQDLERRLGEHLGTKVQVQPGKRKGSGRLVIEFFSFDEFDGLMQRLGFSTGEL
jgi:ParB family transcriptional regulator, chromosome partitioning protein